jgi:hypothetical protein
MVRHAHALSSSQVLVAVSPGRRLRLDIMQTSRNRSAPRKAAGTQPAGHRPQLQPISRLDEAFDVANQPVPR